MSMRKDDLISRRDLIDALNKLAMEHHMTGIPLVEHDFRELIYKAPAKRKLSEKNMERDVSAFFNAQYHAEKTGKKDFICPLCGGKAHWKRSSYNNHLNIWCDACEMTIIE